jgi:pyruvate dehydrogenase E1 component alpha subunit
MHIFDGARRFMGGYGIVGGNLPIAAGLALSSDYRGEDAVTVCMFGDGASNAGNFGETMNLAALWSLPVLFLVENNLYGMGTSVERHSAQTDLSKKAEGYGVPGERIDGMDVLAVRESVAAGIRRAREERRPTLVEAFTYRYRGHSAADPEVYREREEVEEWRAKDPIETFGRRCVEAGVLGEREVQEVRDKAETAVLDAVEFADASPEPALDTLYENLYVLDSDAGWYAVDERSPEPHRGEREDRMPDAARELAEAGAAYAGQPDGPRPNPAIDGDAQEGTRAEVAAETEEVDH